MPEFWFLWCMFAPPRPVSTWLRVFISFGGRFHRKFSTSLRSSRQLSDMFYAALPPVFTAMLHPGVRIVWMYSANSNQRSVSWSKQGMRGSRGARVMQCMPCRRACHKLSRVAQIVFAFSKWATDRTGAGTHFSPF